MIFSLYADFSEILYGQTKPSVLQLKPYQSPPATICKLVYICICIYVYLEILTKSCPAYYIAFGPHGPRAETPKGEGLRVLMQVLKYLAISSVIFFTVRSFAKSPPKTMTKEWQEATNEYAKVRFIYMIPITSFINDSLPVTLPLPYFVPVLFSCTYYMFIYIYLLTHTQREKMDPITGISSEGYSGKGHIQSAPAKKE